MIGTSEEPGYLSISVALCVLSAYTLPTAAGAALTTALRYGQMQLLTSNREPFAVVKIVNACGAAGACGARSFHDRLQAFPPAAVRTRSPVPGSKAALTYRRAINFPLNLRLHPRTSHPATSLQEQRKDRPELSCFSCRALGPVLASQR